MKYLFYSIICTLFLVSCNNINEKESNNFTVEGKLKNLNDPTIYMVTEEQSSAGQNKIVRIDTIDCDKEGKFTYQGSLDSLSSVIIYLEKGNIWTTFWAKNKDKIEINGDVQYPELIICKGGEVNNLLAEFKEQNKELLKENRDLIDRRSSLENVDSLSADLSEMQYTSKILNINHQLKEKAEDFVSEHPNSIASLIIMQDYLIDSSDYENIHKYLSMITGDAVNTHLYKKLLNLANRLQQVAIGSSAPDFTVIDTNNDTLSLGSFKDKLLFLAFAASQCDLCKDENLKLLKIRKKFDASKLAMLTIALDENKADWLKVMQEEKLTWPQVIDTKGWMSEVASAYNISVIPNGFLIGKNGKIIAKNIPADSLEIVITKEITR